MTIMPELEKDELYRLRHSAAHLMAEAVGELHPEVRYAIGPPIEDGFYYDFDLAEPLKDEDLPAIEQKMAEIAARNLPIERLEVSRDQARSLAEQQNQPYKLELIDAIPAGEALSFYRQGNWSDLCRGPHVPSTGHIRHFKLLHTAGAYWRGSEKNKMLTRVYGTAWLTQADLDEYLNRLEEARKRDHRVLGRELGLFMFSHDVGPGLPLWLPKGATLRDTLIDFMKVEQLKRGYQGVVTPNIGNARLYARSGHLQSFRAKMFPLMVGDEEGETYVLKPMNCPHHIMIYASDLRSYRDLPIRYAEFGTVYRYEQSGELAGMLRVRGFTQDDSHLFVTPDQLRGEFAGVVDLMLFTLRRLGLTEYRVRIGTRDPSDDKYIGSQENWEVAEHAIIDAVRHIGLEYEVSPGDAAFYGPKLDLMVRDALRREWQMGTVQVDYNLPERFGLEYIGEDGQKHRPVMIHRAPFGSLDRMIGLLVEHYAGAFPFWLAPQQVALIPIADRHHAYCVQVQDQLREAGIRSAIDSRNEKMGKRIRESELQKVPVMLIAGDRDVEAGSVSIRRHGEGDLGAQTVANAIAMMRAWAVE
ncbi:MAG: threonine--tRNA ligase [Armatimonadetes bacterium]|nr:threonine--tRNA ligase [Armatimonadota bacterium]MDE2206897.1 threonine--tRNA ligase [Armatimonadota bacterium]